MGHVLGCCGRSSEATEGTLPLFDTQNSSRVCTAKKVGYVVTAFFGLEFLVAGGFSIYYAIARDMDRTSISALLTALGAGSSLVSFMATKCFCKARA